MKLINEKAVTKRVDQESFAALLTPDGRAAVTAAVTALDAGADPIGLSTRLRRDFELSPSICASAITQATLRRRGRAKFGPDAETMWFTPNGLEQSTRSRVAAHRAARFAQLLTNPARIADLCCGIGADMTALARTGAHVVGVELDPLTAAVASANAATSTVVCPTVVCGDVEDFDLTGFDAAFIDPSRRGNGRRTFDVRAYSPGWGFVTGLLASLPSAAKLAPGIPHELAPPDTEIEWVSDTGELKEAVLWSPALASKGIRRRATLLPSGATLVAETADNVTASTTPIPTSAPRRYLYEPDPAIVRSHLIGTLAPLLDAALLDKTTAYLTGDLLVRTPFARAFEISDVLPFSLKRLRDLLRQRSIGAVTIMKRGSAVDVEQLRRDLKLSGDGHLVVILALIGGKHQVVLAQPA